MIERRLRNLSETRDAFLNENTYSLQKIEGKVSVDRRKVQLDPGLEVGDSVCFFYLPDGRVLLSKSENPDDLKILLITQAYIQFDGEINLKEV